MNWNLYDVKVIVPIGGEATRLRPLTVETSKATVRLLNRPLIEFPVAELAMQGLKEFIFGVKGYINYRSLFDTFKEGVGFSARHRIKPRVHFKYQPRVDSIGNADSVRINMEYYKIQEPVLVIQGDNIFRLDVRKALEYHDKKEAMMTIILKKWEDVREFGVADLDKEMRIKRFVEKPKRPEDAPSNLINTGIYILSPEIRKVFKSDKMLEMLKQGKMDFGNDVIPYMIDRGYPVYGYVTEDLWFDVGTPDRYLDAMITLLRELPDKEIEGMRIDKDRRIFVQGTSPDSVRRRNIIRNKYRKGKISIEGNVLIGRHCQVNEGSHVENSTIDNFTILGKGVKVINSSVMDRVFLGDGTIVENSIIGRHVEVRSSLGKPVKIINSVIGDDVVIMAGVELIRSRVYPHKIVNEGSKMNDTVLT